MKLEDLIPLLINHGVLICDHIVEPPQITGCPIYLSRDQDRSNALLKDLTALEQKSKKKNSKECVLLFYEELKEQLKCWSHIQVTHEMDNVHRIEYDIEDYRGNFYINSPKEEDIVWLVSEMVKIITLKINRYFEQQFELEKRLSMECRSGQLW
jgi:hypothetical protein